MALSAIQIDTHSICSAAFAARRVGVRHGVRGTWNKCESVRVCANRCPGSEVAMQALTGRKVDLAFRVYQALLGAAADDSAAQPMDTEMQVSTAYNTCLHCSQSSLAVMETGSAADA